MKRDPVNYDIICFSPTYASRKKRIRGFLRLLRHCTFGGAMVLIGCLAIPTLLLVLLICGIWKGSDRAVAYLQMLEETEWR